MHKPLPVTINLNEKKAITNGQPLWDKSPQDVTEEEQKILSSPIPFAGEPLFWIHLNVDYPLTKGIIYF